MNPLVHHDSISGFSKKPHILVTFSSLMVAFVMLVSASPVGAIVTDGLDPPQLVITSFDVDETGHTLTIQGHHFDNGGQLTVTLGGLSLGVHDFTATEITTRETDPNLLVGEYLLVVETGLLPENRDSYAYGFAAEDPIPLPSQLLVFAVESESALPFPYWKYHFTIIGQDFDSGTSLSVKLGPHDLVIDSVSEDTIEASLDDISLFLSTGPGDYLMIVGTGTAAEFRDAHVIDLDINPLYEPPPPLPGESICHTHEPTVCWKRGWGEYFQLLDDYTIDIYSYFAAEENNRTLHWRFRTKAWRNRLVDRLLAISVPNCGNCSGCQTCPVPGWDYLALEYGSLTIKKGYRWDGPSTPRSFWNKKMGNMRASLVHDAIYDLMRLGIITHDGASDGPKTEGGLNRLMADMMFYWLAWDDGRGKSNARASFDIIRIGGAPKTRLVLHDKWPWKWHSVASAGSDLTSDCGPEPVQLDGSGSRWTSSWLWRKGTLQNFGESPQFSFNDGVHEVILTADYPDWLVDYPNQAYLYNSHFYDEDVVEVTVNPDTVPPKFNGLPRPTVTNDAGLCSAVVDFAVTATDDCSAVAIDCLPPPGSSFLVGETTVHCTAEDTSGNPAHAQFPVLVRDIEPPVMTGITAPITLRTRNHKYVTLTVGDFVYSVADNCTALSLEDLVITKVTSSEPEEVKGDGHTTDDFMIAPDGRSVHLRMERRGRGNGRVYTVDIQATDEYGNAVTESFQVQVTHDNKKGRANGF